MYGLKVILHFEVQIPLLPIAIQEDLTKDEYHKLRLVELKVLDKKRLQVQQNLEYYQTRLSRAFNKRYDHVHFQAGDEVLVVRRPIIIP